MKKPVNKKAKKMALIEVVRVETTIPRFKALFGEVWGDGATPNEAVGDLIKNHPEIFNIVIVEIK